MTAIGGLLEWPPMNPWNSTSPGYVAAGLLMDASGEKVAFAITAPKSGTLDQAEFRLATVTAAPASGLRVSFQDVGTDGNPDGTQDQFRDVASGSITSNTWIAPGLMTSDGTNGGVKRTVTAGDVFAVVFEFVSFAAGNSLNISVATIGGNSSFPSCSLFTGAWARSSAWPVLALKYDDGTYAHVPLTVPYSALTSVNYNSGTTPDEIGIKFRLPFGCKVAGLIGLYAPFSSLLPTMKLYDSDGSTVLASLTNDTDLAAIGVHNRHAITFAPVTLLANTYYRATLLPATVANIPVIPMDVNTAAIMDACPGGQDIHGTSRTDAGAWTDTTTRRWPIHLLISDITSSGGGVSRGRATNAGGGLL